MALAQSRVFTLTGREQPELFEGMKTQAALLTILGAKTQLGRVLLPEDNPAGEAPVADSDRSSLEATVQRRSRSRRQDIILNGVPYTVAGVLKRGFSVSSEVMPSEGPMDNVDIFMPMQLGADAAKNRGDENYNVVVRLKRGVSMQQAQADLNIIASRIQEKDERDESFGMHITLLQDEVVGDVRRALLVLLGSVGLVLLIACANVANLLLARGAAREKEIAVRTAMGAGWQQITRQLLTESMLLGVLCGAIGLAFAEASLMVVRAMNPGNIPRLEDIGINGTVLAFTFGVGC